MKTYSIKQQDAIGKEIAAMFQLRRSREHQDRYQTTWGNKTAIGIFNTVSRLGQMIQDGETIKS